MPTSPPVMTRGNNGVFGFRAQEHARRHVRSHFSETTGDTRPGCSEEEATDYRYFAGSRTMSPRSCQPKFGALDLDGPTSYAIPLSGVASRFMDRSQLLKGLLPAMVLAVIADGDTYGYGVLRELRRLGLDSVGDASVYGTLQRLFDEGLLASYLAEPTIGPSRRYYALTTSGRARLKHSLEDWDEFESIVSSVLKSVPKP